MSLQAMYDQIARHYIIADKFGALSQSHTVALEQIKQTALSSKKPIHVLDFGVGDAAFLKKLDGVLPSAELFGIDISAEMLLQAQQTLPKLHTTQADSAKASHYFPLHSQDLVLAHFINAYIPVHTLFEQAELLTKANGYFSLITTTYESFPVAQDHLAQYIASKTLWSSVVGHYYKSMVGHTTVAADLGELFEALHLHHFNVVQHQRLRLPIQIKDLEELAEFGIEGTWFLNTLNHTHLPRSFLMKRIREVVKDAFEFPYEDTHVIDVILAEKV